MRKADQRTKKRDMDTRKIGSNSTPKNSSLEEGVRDLVYEVNQCLSGIQKADSGASSYQRRIDHLTRQMMIKVEAFHLLYFGKNGQNSDKNEEILGELTKIIPKQTNKSIATQTGHSSEIRSVNIDAQRHQRIQKRRFDDLQARKTIAKIGLAVHQIRDHTEENRRDSLQLSLLAVKNHNSYLIVTSEDRLTVIEDNTQIYSGGASRVLSSSSDIIYVKSLDSYLIHTGKRILRKEIDDSPPHRFTRCKIQCSDRPSAVMKYSQIHNKLITFGEKIRTIIAVNLETEIEEFRVRPPSLNQRIANFELFGENEDQVACVFKDGKIYRYSLDYHLKASTYQSCCEFELFRGRSEELSSVTVCSKNRYMFVKVVNQAYKVCSRLAVIGLVGTSFVILAFLDEYDNLFRGLTALNFLGYFGEHVLWVGLAQTGYDQVVQIYDYVVCERKLRELKGKRRRVKESNAMKMSKIDDHLYFADGSRKVMRLSLQI